MTTAEFETVIDEALVGLPARFQRYLENAVILVADEPSPLQRQRSGIRPTDVLFGLYEGVPRTERQGRPTSLPDTITLFRRALERISPDRAALVREVRATIEHEIGHHLGLNEAAVRRVDRRRRLAERPPKQ